MEKDYVGLSLLHRRQVTLCNHNFSREGIYHPDRRMTEYDLLYMQNGEWDIVEDDNLYHVQPGSVLLLEPGKHHYSRSKCSPLMRNVYIHFSVADEDIPSEDVPHEFKTSEDETSEASNYLFLPKLVQCADHSEIRHSFEKVIDAFWSEEAKTKALRCSLYLENLLLQLSELGNTTTGKPDILISEIIHRFHCEPEIFLSPEELAKNYNVSVRTISGRFKKQTGLSIHQYQLQLKLNMAYDVLPISPGRSLHDIALSYGFYDEFQFSKLFKKKFGISPSDRR